MATNQTVPAIHPGDLIQATSNDARRGHIFLVSQVKSWGFGAIQRFLDGGDDHEAYHRFKFGEFVVVGSAHILPVELAQARADSVATGRAVAKDAGALVEPVTRCPACGVTVFQSSDSTSNYCAAHSEPGK